MMLWAIALAVAPLASSADDSAAPETPPAASTEPQAEPSPSAPTADVAPPKVSASPAPDGTAVSAPTEAEYREPDLEFIDEPQIPARTIYIELSRVIRAKTYEIQIRPAKEQWREPYQFLTAEQSIRVRLTPGYYQIRTRSKDDRGKPGPWRAWARFRIQFKPPIHVFPADGSVIEVKGDKTERVTFEWPASVRAKFYYFVLYDSNMKMLRQVKTKKTWFANTVNMHSKYFWAVIPQLEKSDPIPPKGSYRVTTFIVSEPNLNLRPVLIEVDPVRNADKYQYEFVKVTKDNQLSEPSVFETREATYEFRLSPGHYEMRARGVAADGRVSDWGPPHTVEIPYGRVAKISPQPDEVVESNDTTNSKVRLQWTDMIEPDRYHVNVFNGKGERILSKDTRDTYLDVELEHDSEYSWTVEALNPGDRGRVPASVTELKEPAQGFSINQYIKLELSTTEEPSQLYSWGRLGFSQANYEYKNWDNYSKVDQKLLTSSAELAIGYWHRKTNFGLLGAASLNGFTVTNDRGGQDVSAKYGRYSLLLGYRHKVEESAARFRAWFGYSFHQIPEILAIPVPTGGGSGQTDTRYDVSMLTNAGPELRLFYMNDLSGPWGYHLNGRFYKAMQSKKTPNGQPLLSASSLSLGAYLTYKIDPRWTALGGYNYELQSAQYKSTDRTGNPNDVSMNGHYVTIMFMWGLQPAVK